MVLKSMKPENRELRSVFVGRRLKIKQYQWLHFNTHPDEADKPCFLNDAAIEQELK